MINDGDVRSGLGSVMYCVLQYVTGAGLDTRRPGRLEFQELSKGAGLMIHRFIPITPSGSRERSACS